jgi:hypothetical protein
MYQLHDMMTRLFMTTLVVVMCMTQKMMQFLSSSSGKSMYSSSGGCLSINFVCMFEFSCCCAQEHLLGLTEYRRLFIRLFLIGINLKD